MTSGGRIGRRLLQILPTLAMIAVAAFLLVRLLPGDPVSTMLGDRGTPEAVARLRTQMGLDGSLAWQFWSFVRGLLHGDLGESITRRVPVSRLIAERLPVTLYLTALSAVLAMLLAVPLAFVAAVWRDRLPDLLIRGVFQVGLSAPVFYIGLLLLGVLAARWRVFPVGGMGHGVIDSLWHLFLPALTLALSLSAVLMRSLRAAVIGVLRADYVDFARAKGLSPALVLGRHVLRNALISTVPLFGMNVGALLGGAVVAETVFAVPGVGALMIESIYGRDYPVVQGLTLSLAVLVCLVFLATDLVESWLDPRTA
jgi:peptide/nickel transport system permease protein